MKKLLQKLDTLGLLLLVAAAIWYSVTNIWDGWNIVLAAAGLLCVVAGLAVNYRQILATLGKRSTKYAGNYILSLILVVAVVSGLNYIGQKHPKRFDLTSGGQYSLAPQTVKILRGLDRDVEIKAFPSGGEDAAHDPAEHHRQPERLIAPLLQICVSGQLHCIEALITEEAAELRGHAEYCAVDMRRNEETAQFMDVFTHLT